MKTLVIEGWRGINHSYALVNQHQLLGLAACPDFAIYHVDAPLPRAGWQSTGSGFDEDDAAIIDGFGSPPPNMAVDVLYRMSFPFRFDGSRAKRTLVFGTAELGRIPRNFIDSDAAPGDAHGGKPRTPRSENPPQRQVLHGRGCITPGAPLLKSSRTC